jgi:hypothetical protein
MRVALANESRVQLPTGREMIQRPPVEPACDNEQGARV